MKISLNLIRFYQKMYGWSADPAPDGIEALVEKIGSQLGGVEGVESIGEKYQGAVVVKVVSCEPHPDSDHMNVCRVDDGGKTPDVPRGEDGLVQVVCGAPNVTAGLTAVWLPPGSTVPESYGKDPFVLGARELRGVTSNGMLASPRELALGDNHDGILVITDEVVPGTSFVDAYELDDYIIDIENKMFTHRPDLFGHIGVAREIAGIQGQPFTSPDWYSLTATAPKPAEQSLHVSFQNELPELVPRFVLVPMSGITVAPSSLWLQTYLNRLGVRAINNVVDYTNYYMMLTGQPLHAYDYDKVVALSSGSGENGASIVVRNPREGEQIALLNGKTITPRPEAIMIATDQQLIGVGGVMGGAKTEVDENTKNIILEVATFDMYSIRRTSMAHGLFTDAVTRFNKGQSPLQNMAIAAKVAEELAAECGASVGGEVVDYNEAGDRQWVHPPVPVTTEFINKRLGLELSAADMKTLLENVEFQVAIESDQLTVTAPFWRTDVETREDVVEEIGRLYGFDKLPLELPRRSIKPAIKNEALEFKAKIRTELAKAGASEVLNYSFVHGDLLRKAGQNPDDAFQVSNALSPDLQYYRLSLTPSVLANVHPNIKAGYPEFALFELGKGHNLQHAADDDGLPMEFDMLEFVYARSDTSHKSGAAFYEARAFLRKLTNRFGLELAYRPIEHEEDYPVAKPYDHGRSAQIWVKDTEIALGMIGEYKASVRKALKLPVHTAGFGLSITQLMKAAENPSIEWYKPLPRFPRVTQDITLKVPANTVFQPFYTFLRAELERQKPEQTHANLSVLDIYQSKDDASHKQLTFRLSIASYEKTMTDKEVATLLGLVAAAAKDKCGAEQI